MTTALSATKNTTAPDDNCPGWCIAPHDEDSAFHYGDIATFTDVNGLEHNVGRWWDETKRQAGFYLGAHEISYEAASELGSILGKGAMLAAMNVLGDPNH